jgi:hypothetical protein
MFMKKNSLVAVFLLCVSFSFGQLNFGIKAAYNSSLSFSNINSVTTGAYNLHNVSDEMWTNFQAGLFARLSINKIYFQPELLYSIQKTNYSLTLNDVINKDVTVDKFINISTIDVPLLLGYKIFDLKILNLRAFAGPKLRFDLASNPPTYTKVSGGNFDPNSLLSSVKKAQLGMDMGLGLDLLMLTLDVRYNLIGNMYDAKLSDFNLPSNTFVISLGWKIF